MSPGASHAVETRQAEDAGSWQGSVAAPSHIPVRATPQTKNRTRVMWICPKCKESIEDQFDSCWKCAGVQQQPMPINDLAWMYPVISLAALIGLGSFIGAFCHSPHQAGGYFGFGGAAIGVIVSAVGIWAFFGCPLHHWIPKVLTLLFLVAALFYGVITVGSFFIHVLGYDAA
jgi:hypothetical protein